MYIYIYIYTYICIDIYRNIQNYIDICGFPRPGSSEADTPCNPAWGHCKPCQHRLALHGTSQPPTLSPHTSVIR